MSIRPIISSFIAVLIAIFVAAPSYAAGNASFSLTSSASTAQTGATITINVFENGTNVNAITAKLNFDSSRLQLLSTSCGASFSNSIAETNGATCYAPGGKSVNGATLAISARFKALSTGGATVSITGDSKIASDGTNIWNGIAPSTNITITTPPAKTPTTPPSTSGSGSKNTSKNTAATKTENTASNTDTTTASTTKKDLQTSTTTASEQNNESIEGVSEATESTVTPVNTFWKDTSATISTALSRLWWFWFMLIGAGLTLAIQNRSKIKSYVLSIPFFATIRNNKK